MKRFVVVSLVILVARFSVTIGFGLHPCRSRNACSSSMAATRRRRTRHLNDSTASRIRLFSNGGDDQLSKPPLMIHHAALKTRNITTAIQFYSLLGFDATAKFRAGPARAAWLELGCGACRLEVIEVPSYMLKEEPGVSRQRAPNLMTLQDVLGYNHVALDVTNQIEYFHSNNKSFVPSLSSWMDRLNEQSVERFDKTLRIALPPQQQIIGRSVYELAFIYDADGCLVELLHKLKELNQKVDSGWVPWDGEGFAGLS